MELLITSPEEKKVFWEKAAQLPKIILTERQLCDLELLLNGGFAPLQGFMTEEEYKSVVETMRLPSGRLWPIPIVLDVPESAAYKIGEEVILMDAQNNPLAILTISSVYIPNKEWEADHVFKTRDELHYGVRYLFRHTHNKYLGGSVKGISLPKRYDFQELRYTPAEIKKWFKENNWNKIVGFQTRNPMHRAHFELVRRAAQDHDAKVLIHPSVGLTKDGDIDYVTRVRVYKKIHDHYAGDFAKISLLPLAMRMGGPREAVWHALIRKNYGVTHFIVGRDHAGPGKNKEGENFYGPYDAQNLVKEHAAEIGLTIIDPKEMVYVEEHNNYFPVDQLPQNATVKNISGTQFRAMLRNKEPVPTWFSFPEVIQELYKAVDKETRAGYTVFFTGLSGSGKSTIAHMLQAKLMELQDRSISILDGDIVRHYLSKGLGFSKEDRNTNIERIGYVASEITKHGGIAICSAIAPYEEARLKNRELISRQGTYIEIYLSTPIEICETRDVKGLYKKARAGIMKGFTGIDDPYEIPQFSNITIDTSKVSPEESVSAIIAYLKQQKLLD